MSPWLITGANGFLGRHVLDRIRSRDDLFLFGRRVPEGWPSERFDQVDLRSAESVRTAVHKVRPAVVLHLAGLTPPANAEELYQTNVIGTLHLLDALQSLSSPVRLIVAGSAAELGPVPDEALPVAEDYPPRPAGAYGLSKHLASVAALAAPDPIETIVTRIFNPIGPGTPRAQALGRFAWELRNSPAGTVDLCVGDLGSKRDFIDIRDVARIMIALAETGSAGLYHIGTGVSHSIAEGLDLLIALSGRKVSVRIDQSLANRAGPRDSRADLTRVSQQIEFSFAYDFEQSIEDLWESTKI